MFTVLEFSCFELFFDFIKLTSEFRNIGVILELMERLAYEIL